MRNLRRRGVSEVQFVRAQTIGPGRDAFQGVVSEGAYQAGMKVYSTTLSRLFSSVVVDVPVEMLADQSSGDAAHQHDDERGDQDQCACG
jgi:hypothetical protein